MHRTTVAIVLLLALASFPAAGTASGVTVSVTAPDAVSPGETVTVTVEANASSPLYGIQYTLGFDAASLSVERVEQGSLFTSQGTSLLLAKDIDEGAGKVEYGETRQNTDDGITGTGTVTRITFVVADSPASNELAFTLSEVKASDPAGQPIGTTVESTSSSVEGADGDGDGNTAGSTVTATATGEPVTATWRDKLTVTLERELSGSAVVPVVVVVADDAELDPVAAATEGAGGNEVRVLESIHAVAAELDRDALETVATRSDVVRLRYDSQATVTTADDAPTDGTAETPTATDGEPTATTTSPGADGTTAASSGGTRTATSANGFGVVATLLALLTLAFARQQADE
jgi:hypothetical protein